MYKFNKYFDVPIEILDTIQYSNGQYSRFYERIESFSVSNQVSTKSAMTLSVGASTTLGSSLGASSHGVSVGISSSSKISMNATQYTEVQYNKNQTHSVQEKVSYTETYVNNTNKDMYFQRNYRQKFAAYLMVKYKYEYTVNQWGSGLGG